jgi:hypothetical protein
MTGIREKLNESGSLGTGAVVAGLLIAAFIAYFAFRNAFGPSPAARMSSERVYVCAETGKSFKYTPGENELYPVMSPFSGKKTGYPGEACYWTKDGTVKPEPTWVLRNNFKGVKGPTFCPECGRWMDPNAGPVAAGMDPPPTKEEYLKQRKGKRESDEEEQ